MIRSDERPAEPFVAWAQQREAARLGMWLFLASEAMMFGSLIMVAWFFRLRYPDGVAEAVAGLSLATSQLLDQIGGWLASLAPPPRPAPTPPPRVISH